jgi:hypothetical protein
MMFDKHGISVRQYNEILRTAPSPAWGHEVPGYEHLRDYATADYWLPQVSPQLGRSEDGSAKPGRLHEAPAGQRVLLGRLLRYSWALAQGVEKSQAHPGASGVLDFPGPCGSGFFFLFSGPLHGTQFRGPLGHVARKLATLPVLGTHPSTSVLSITVQWTLSLKPLETTTLLRLTWFIQTGSTSRCAQPKEVVITLSMINAGPVSTTHTCRCSKARW